LGLFSEISEAGSLTAPIFKSALTPHNKGKMTDSISPETFAHLVDLAALELSQKEADYLLQQMNNQLNALRDLAAIPLDETAPVTSHGVPYTIAISQLPRSDTWQAFPAPEEILAQAPQAEDDYIIVPDIPHTKLD
jgi:aspartyl-tRNA(Asn)/glutamyl-tRNA(Gln) amidotransferase subunit C